MKNELGNQLTRRQFLSWVSGSAGFLAAHQASANPESFRRVAARSHRILSLELLTSAPLADMKEFYNRSLGLAILDEKPDRLTLSGGKTRLTFVKTEGNPFYHFAFNIPQNKLLAAHSWQKQRSPLMPVPPHLRDPEFPDDVVHFSHWNAHSVFFYDPGGNVVEYIARHTLNNNAPGPFESKDIHYASEIGFIVDDVRATASKLKEVADAGQYKGGDEQFTAIGDELGLLLVMKRGRHLNFNQSDSSKAARVFRTVASVQGSQQSKFSLPSFPYEISVEA